MGRDNISNTDIEKALRGLVKLLKAVRYYPPRHPALKTATAEVLREFAPLLRDGQPLALEVHKKGFALQGEALPLTNPAVQTLAPFLFARLVQRLLVLPGLDPRDLGTFCRTVSQAPVEIHRQGGMPEALQKAMVSTIWVNVTDLNEILDLKAGLEAQKEAFPGLDDEWVEQADTEIGEQRDLEAVLQELERAENDHIFQERINELVPLLRPAIAAAEVRQVFRALKLLARHAKSTEGPEARREACRQAFAQLSGAQDLDALIGLLCLGELSKDGREALTGLLTCFSSRVNEQLMARLATEEDARVRKVLTAALVRQGSAALPVLTTYLDDGRWYVARNAVAIIGELRDPSATALLWPLLSHEEVRVRREAIRALTKIGGAEAVDTLLKVVAGEDQDLRRHAILSLGAMKHPAAVDPLLGIVNRPDRMVRLADEKKLVIKALGEIGSATAVPDLVALLRSRKLLGRTRHAELRAAAATALGQIGGKEAAEALEKATDDPFREVARAATLALKQKKKPSAHES